MPGLLARDRIIAPPGFNRWFVPPASVAIHLCIGSVYAWSMFDPALIKMRGVVASAADEWTLGQTNLTYTLAIVSLGLSAAFGGKWMEKVGPRMVGTVAACCWGGGFLVGALGIHLHQLWLLYLGYGVIGGCGLGLGYVSPVSALVKWFPDRRGMAAGMAIMGFGGGAFIGVRLIRWLIRSFSEVPVRIGSVEEVTLVTKAGRRFTEVAGELREVVVVGSTEVKQMLVGSAEGVYQVGTGHMGVAETFVALGLVYFVVMIAAAFSYRLPADGWLPAGWTPPSEDEAAKEMITTHQISADEALKTPQFYLVWIVLCFNVTAGIGVLGVAKTMMKDFTGGTQFKFADAAFAANYVLWISVFNMAGRFFWATVSDYIGRKTTYTVFFVLGIALYLSIPLTAFQLSVSPAVIWLVYFYAATLIIFTMYGGGFATIPAYLADLFGAKNVGGIHGRLLTAWSTAGVLGPLAITSLRERTRLQAIKQLVEQIDPAEFAEKFGAPVGKLKELVELKTVTISQLMEIAPAGTQNPTPTLYNTTMYLMAALLAVALVCNLLIRPVDPKHFSPDETA